MIPRRKDSPPLPETLPGGFAVITYDRDAEDYQLLVDDVLGSSYLLGSDVQAIMDQFRMWGLYEILCNTLDVAREYGSAQGIFADGRVIPLFDRRDDRSIWNQEPKGVYLPSGG